MNEENLYDLNDQFGDYEDDYAGNFRPLSEQELAKSISWRAFNRSIIVGFVFLAMGGFVVLMGFTAFNGSLFSFGGFSVSNLPKLIFGFFVLFAVGVGSWAIFSNVKNKGEMRRNIQTAEVYRVVFGAPASIRTSGGRHGRSVTVTYRVRFKRAGQEIEIETHPMSSREYLGDSIVEIAYFPSINKMAVLKRITSIRR